MNEIQITEIKQIELEISFYKEQTAQNIIEIGKRLIKAKELVPHGEWGKWLEDKAQFKQRNANRFMQVANEFSNSSALTNLTQTKVFTLLSLPIEEREDFIKDNPVEDMTTRELQQAIKEKKELEKKVEELQNQEPKVIETEVETIPDDYYQMKAREIELQVELERLQLQTKNQLNIKDYNNLRKELTSKSEEIYDLKKQLEQTVLPDNKEVQQQKLKDTAITFSNRVHSFINSVGGLGWMIDYLDELPKYEKEEYAKAVDLIDQWVTTIKSNL